MFAGTSRPSTLHVGRVDRTFPEAGDRREDPKNAPEAADCPHVGSRQQAHAGRGTGEIFRRPEAPPDSPGEPARSGGRTRGLRRRLPA